MNYILQVRVSYTGHLERTLPHTGVVRSVAQRSFLTDSVLHQRFLGKYAERRAPRALQSLGTEHIDDSVCFAEMRQRMVYVYALDSGYAGQEVEIARSRFLCVLFERFYGNESLVGRTLSGLDQTGKIQSLRTVFTNCDGSVELPDDRMVRNKSVRSSIENSLYGIVPEM